MKPCLPSHQGTRHGSVHDPEEQVTRGAHVVAWEKANGRRVRPREVVRHSCDNPPCIEPTHLLIGSRRDNWQDMVDRHPERVYLPPRRTGEKHGRHKLTDKQVDEIRAAYTGMRGQKAELARQYGVSKPHITNLVERRQRVEN